MLSFIPSAYFYLQHGGAGIYVKYGHYPDKIIVKSVTGRNIWIQCPDRELLLVGDAHLGGPLRPLNCNFDEYYSLGLDCGVDPSLGISGLMLNYFQYLDTKIDEMSPDNRMSGKSKKNHVEYISDSGGFQIAMGKIQYIDPTQLVAWYNKNVDVGIALDIPTSCYSDDLLLDTARLQKRCSNVMFKQARPDLHMMNVIHGGTTKQFMKYHKAVYDPRFRELCIAGTYHGGTLDMIKDLMHVIQHTDYDRYHILGVYNTAITPLLARVAAVTGKRITSDASTALQAAMRRGYHFQSELQVPYTRLSLGYNSRCSYPSTNKHLPCSCPVCRALKYSDILGFLSGASSLINYLIMFHNIYDTVNYTTMMSKFAEELEPDQYKDLVAKQLMNHPLKKQAAEALDYIEERITDGPRSANARHKASMTAAEVVNSSQHDTTEEREYIESVIGVFDAELALNSHKRIRVSTSKKNTFSSSLEQRKHVHGSVR